MSIDARINRLMPVLSARERAVLVLRSLKDKTPEDLSWRRSMPREQVNEFNRYIGLMNACNMQVAHMITIIEKDVEKHADAPHSRVASVALCSASMSVRAREAC
jgi:hypothetical protein